MRPFALTLYPETLKHKFLFSENIDILIHETLVMYMFLVTIFLLGVLTPVRLQVRRDVTFIRYSGLRSPEIFLTALLILSCTVTFYFIGKTGGVVQLIYQSRHGLFAESSYVFQKLPSITLMLLTIGIILNPSRWLIILASFAAGNSLLYGERGTLVICMIAIAVISLRRGNIGRKKFFFIVLISAIILLLLGQIRTLLFLLEEDMSSLGRSTHEESFAFKLLYSISSFFNLETYDHFLVVYQDLKYNLDFRLGYDLYLGIVGIIPRFLWQDKPEIILLGGWFSNYYMPGTGGKPITALGYYYFNFGLFGCAVIMYFTGLLFRFFEKNKSMFIYQTFVIYFFFFSAFGIIGQNIFMAVILNGVPIIFFTFFCYRLKLAKSI